MVARLKIVDRDTPMMLPPDIRDWLPKDHIVHFLDKILVSIRIHS